MLLRLRFTLLCVFSLLACRSWAQTTINVGPNQPYTTIQSGINAAQNGDTVLVAPGTYAENIDFKGKAITVTSSGGAAVTTIDGAQKAPAVIFNKGESRTAVLSGFSIQHGGVLNLPYSTNSGGIYLQNSSPTIRNNVLTQNNCWTIYSLESAPLIQNNIISATRDPQGSCSFGGGAGVFLQGNLQSSPATNNGTSAMVLGNTIENNVESGLEDAGGNGGAGIAVWSSSTAVIMNNSIHDNASPGGSGGGINVIGGQGVAIVQNLIYRNSAGCGGGALAIQPSTDPRTGISVLVANNTMVDNIDKGGGGFSECTNISQIYPWPESYGFGNPSALFLNNIVSGSTSDPAINCGSNMPTEATQPTFQNDILYNAGGSFFGARCADVTNKYNNVAADPAFVNALSGDYHLRSTSPAINHGQNTVRTIFQNLTGLTLLTDFDGNSRVQSESEDGCTIDIGAYEYPGSNSQCGTSITIQSSPNPSTYGQTVTFTAQISSQNGTPTGSVQFSDGTTLLGTQTLSASGVATFASGQLTVGSHTITAAYQPTGNFPATTATLKQVVNGTATTTQLTSSRNPAIAGQSVTFNVAVTSQSGMPSGSITLTDGSGTLAVLPLNAGTATYNTTALSVGSHQITATFVASGIYAASSATLAETINGQPTATTLSITPNPATAFGTFTLSSTVKAASGAPSGTVTFTSNGLKLGSAPLSDAGQALLTLPAPAAGTYNILATYSGDTTYNTSSSSPVSELVIAAASATTLTASPNPAYQSQPVSLTANVTGTAGQTPTGTVTFYDGSAKLGTATLSAAGIASLSVTTLAPGTHTLTAAYGGSGSYTGSTSAAIQEQILPGSFGIALSPAAITLGPGQQGTVQITLNSIGGFSGPLQLSFGTLPAYAVATLSPATVTLTAGGSGALNPSTASVQSPQIFGAKRSSAALIALAALLLPLRLRSRRSLRGLLGIVALAVLLSGISGCGMIRVPFQTAQAGVYQIPITATDTNHNSHSATLTLTVTR